MPSNRPSLNDPLFLGLLSNQIVKLCSRSRSPRKRCSMPMRQPTTSTPSATPPCCATPDGAGATQPRAGRPQYGAGLLLQPLDLLDGEQPAAGLPRSSTKSARPTCKAATCRWPATTSMRPVSPTKAERCQRAADRYPAATRRALSEETGGRHRHPAVGERPRALANQLGDTAVSEGLRLLSLAYEQKGCLCARLSAAYGAALVKRCASRSWPWSRRRSATTMSRSNGCSISRSWNSA